MSTDPRVLGKYELRERLGRGGMAEVWKAFDPQLKRYVAIKFLQTDQRSDPTFATRFVREGQAVASLRHPNIICIYDFEASAPAAGTSNNSQGSMAYMVMDYVEGQTLADYIRNTAYVHKFPSTGEIIHLFIPICSAIDYAHRHSMIHRDIKPANILLDQHNTSNNPMGEPILTDFGIVKMLGTDTGTLTTTSVGTPLYVSPEQVKGQPGNEASDIYSLGVTLYEVCTGEPPFSGDNLYAIIHQHIHTPPRPPRFINPTLSPALEAVILRCLAKDPAQRFPNIAALTAALMEILHESTAEMRGQSIYLSDTMARPDHSTPGMGAVAPSAQVEKVGNVSAFSTETPPTQSARPHATPETPYTAPSAPRPASARRSRRGLAMALIVLLSIVLGGAGLGTYLVYFAHLQSSAVVGHGFFASSGQSSSSTNQGSNDTFQLHLTNVANPASGKSYYAWLLPDTNQSEALSLNLGPLSITNGAASLSATYVNPQHANLIAAFSRLLVTEEATSPPPQSYSLDKNTWRYYAEIPQSPASKICTSSLSQLSDLCHLRHLLSADPELQQVGLPFGLNYWFLNNVEEIQKWAREAIDHNAATDIRHKMINILYMLDGMQCIAPDLQKAFAGADNTPDDGSLTRIAAIPLLNCALTPSQPGYLIHIHNHLNAITQAPGVLSDQATLAIQIGTELNSVSALLSQLHTDVQKLIAMDNTHIKQADGQALRTAIDALATRILSGGNDPTTGNPESGVAQIAAQIQQLATFDIMVYTAQ